MAKRIGPRMVAVLLAVTILLNPIAMPMAEARSGSQPIMPTPIAGAALAEAVGIAEQFLQRNPDGTLTLNMPRRVIRTIGEDVYAQLQAGLAAANEKVSRGYLKFDDNFEAYVTERYLDKVKATIALHQQSLAKESHLHGITASEIAVSRSGNRIIVDFDILGGGDVGILSVGGGVNGVTLHWWGLVIYWCSEIVDGINKGTLQIGTALAVAGIWLAGVGGKIIATLGVLIGAEGAMLSAICDGRGVRLIFWWIPLPLRLVAIQPQ